MCNTSSVVPSLWAWHRWLSYLTGYGGVWHKEARSDTGISMGCQLWCNIITSADEIKMSGKSDATEDQIPAHITLKSVRLDWCSKIFWFVSQKVFLSQRSDSRCLTLCFSRVFPAPHFLSFLWYFVRVDLTSFSGCLSDTFASSGKCFYILHCEISQTEEGDFLGLLTLTTKTPFVSSSC